MSATAARELVEAARRQMRELPYYNTFFQTATPPSVELAAKLGRDRARASTGCSTPAPAPRRTTPWSSWCATSGTCRASPSKKIFISRALRLSRRRPWPRPASSGMPAMHGQADLPLPGFDHIGRPTGTPGRRPDARGLRPAGRAGGSRRDPRAGPGQRRRLHRRADPGRRRRDRPARRPTGRRSQRICREYDVLLVADEVICGFGRTGDWWGCERFGITPDIMTDRQGPVVGLPADRGGRWSATRIGDALVAAGRRVDPRLHLFRPPGGRAVALENIRIIEDEGLHERAARDDRRLFPQAAGRRSPTIRWSARCAPAACSARSSWSRTRRRAGPFAPSAQVGARLPRPLLRRTGW